LTKAAFTLATFRIDVTFEMRTVLYGIHLLIDDMKMSDRIFISNRDCGEEKRIVERQRDRERECARGSALQKIRDDVGHKMSC
jgi:hypothetical protein